MVPPSSIEPSTHTAGNSSQHASPSVTSDQELPHQELHLPKRRKLQDTQWSPLLPNDSEAAHLNRRVLKKLQSAFDKNPEVDLLSVFPLGYSDRLPKKIGEPVKKGQEPSRHAEFKETENRNNDIRSILDTTCPTEIVHPLSTSIKDVIGCSEQDLEENELSQHVSNLLSKSEVIDRGPIPTTRTIFRCSPTAVVKVIWNADDYTEYTTLQFLDKYVPNVPAPKPLGVLRVGQLSLIFVSYIPGKTMKETWPQLTIDQKLSVMDQLGRIFLTLRSTNCPPNSPLGGLTGEGCKDLRRNVRRSKGPIYSVEQFDDFLFSCVRYGSNSYLKFLRKFTCETSSKVCLSHGDVQQDNIMVQRNDNGVYEISGLLDWEFSGFYPSHYESTKATNCLSTNETSDWYDYLPSCLSPYTWPRRWLLDYVLGRLIE